ncbi:hypothetical protein C2S52_003268 [Perilla frutescens var. hirtella]|nr:hypothetical protein C2S52_003268 [Perilla frutescens var. hirtella]
MISDAQLTPDWRNGFGWKRRGGGAVAPLSARQLAASLWRLGGGSVRGLSFDRFGFQIPKYARKCESKAWDCADYFEAEGGRWRMMNEERASPSMCLAVINNLAEGIKSERKICKNMDKMNAKMVRDVGEAKLSARKLKWRLEKEKKARKELEGVCYDLANELKSRKAEIGALRKEQRRIREQVEEERRMREVGEVWREERAQMKLADANLILEDKYAEINQAMAHLRAFHAESNTQNIQAAAGICKNPHVVGGIIKPHIHDWPTFRLTKC